MEKEEILAVLGVALGLPTLVQISPIKINPLSWIWKMLKRMWLGFCRSLNAPVLAAVENQKAEQLASWEKVTQDLRDTKKALDLHIAMDVPAVDATPEELYDLALTLVGDSGGLGIYPWGIHIDCRPIKSRWDYRGK